MRELLLYLHVFVTKVVTRLSVVSFCTWHLRENVAVTVSVYRSEVRRAAELRYARINETNRITMLFGNSVF